MTSAAAREAQKDAPVIRVTDKESGFTFEWPNDSSMHEVVSILNSGWDALTLSRDGHEYVYELISSTVRGNTV